MVGGGFSFPIHTTTPTRRREAPCRWVCPCWLSLLPSLALTAIIPWGGRGVAYSAVRTQIRPFLLSFCAFFPFFCPICRNITLLSCTYQILSLHLQRLPTRSPGVVPRTSDKETDKGRQMSEFGGGQTPSGEHAAFSFPVLTA